MPIIIAMIARAPPTSTVRRIAIFFPTSAACAAALARRISLQAFTFWDTARLLMFATDPRAITFDWASFCSPDNAFSASVRAGSGIWFRGDMFGSG